MRYMLFPFFLLSVLTPSESGAQAVRTTVRTYDEVGLNEIDSIEVGKKFTAKVFVQDISEGANGVFAAYPDILFDANKLSVIQDEVFPIPDCRDFEHPGLSYVDFKSPYSCGIQEGTIPEPGRLDGVGAFSEVFENDLGGDEYELFSVVMHASSVGVARITPESSSDPNDPFDEEQSALFGTLVYGVDDFICPNEDTCVGNQEFVGDSIVVTGNSCGDFDSDDDVDAADRIIQTVGWTGALGAGVGNAAFDDGDCDGDGDVDSADRNGLIRNWTGARQAGSADGDGNAELIYDPETGTVVLDASKTASEVLISFVMGTNQDSMDADKASLPFVNVGTNTDLTSFQIGQTDPLNQGAGPLIELGQILPTGMDVEQLSQYLTLAEYASELGVGGAFDMVVVPEPTSVQLLLLGCVALIRRRQSAGRRTFWAA